MSCSEHNQKLILRTSLFLCPLRAPCGLSFCRSNSHTRFSISPWFFSRLNGPNTRRRSSKNSRDNAPCTLILFACLSAVVPVRFASANSVTSYRMGMWDIKQDAVVPLSVWKSLLWKFFPRFFTDRKEPISFCNRIINC